MGEAGEPRRGTEQLAQSVLADARASGRARGPPLHRRGDSRPVALARLPDRDRVADGYRLRAAAVVLDSARPRCRRCRARPARGARRAAAVVRRLFRLATACFRDRELGHFWTEHRAAGTRDFDPAAHWRGCGRGAGPAAARNARGGARPHRSLLGHLHSRTGIDHPGLAGVVDGAFAQSRSRIWRGADAREPVLRAHRRADRDVDRSSSRHRPDRDHRDAAAADFSSRADVGLDHARRHFLRRAIRRIDDRYPGEPAGRDFLGGHLHRRSPDGAAGPRPPGAAPGPAGLVPFEPHLPPRAPPPAPVGQSFGAPEYFSLMVLGLIAAVVLAHGSVIKAIAMIVLGLLFGLVGTDGNTGGTRFTFGITELTDGIDIATLAIGIFGIGEIITNLTQPQETRGLVAKK